MDEPGTSKTSGIDKRPEPQTLHLSSLCSTKSEGDRQQARVVVTDGKTESGAPGCLHIEQEPWEDAPGAVPTAGVSPVAKVSRIF